jgi:hypothetical protein
MVFDPAAADRYPVVGLEIVGSVAVGTFVVISLQQLLSLSRREGCAGAATPVVSSSLIRGCPLRISRLPLFVVPEPFLRVLRVLLAISCIQHISPGRRSRSC